MLPFQHDRDEDWEVLMRQARRQKQTQQHEQVQQRRQARRIANDS